MALDEKLISEAIISRYFDKLRKVLEVDVALAGAGPANLVASYYLARAGLQPVIFESKLAPGGGMWGGGIMFNEIVIQKEAVAILEEFGVRHEHYQDEYYVADSVHTTATLISRTVAAGTIIFNLLKVVDVMFREADGKPYICGVVIQYTPVDHIGLHVDPITVRAGYVVDATGHAAEVAHVVRRKSGCTLDTPTGDVVGERPMWAEEGERAIVENTREFFPGVYAAGMCANAVFGAPRMGPIFGGMLMSGRRVAELLLSRL